MKNWLQLETHSINLSNEVGYLGYKIGFFLPYKLQKITWKIEKLHVIKAITVRTKDQT